MYTLGTKDGYALLFEDQRDLEIIIKHLQDHLEWRKANKKPLQKSLYMSICDELPEEKMEDAFTEVCQLFDIDVPEPQKF